MLTKPRSRQSKMSRKSASLDSCSCDNSDRRINIRLTVVKCLILCHSSVGYTDIGIGLGDLMRLLFRVFLDRDTLDLGHSFRQTLRAILAKMVVFALR